MKPIFVVMFCAHEDEHFQLAPEYGYFPFEKEREVRDLVKDLNLRIGRINYFVVELEKKVMIKSEK